MVTVRLRVTAIEEWGDTGMKWVSVSDAKLIGTSARG
jgi:hypothetical protein